MSRNNQSSPASSEGGSIRIAVRFALAGLVSLAMVPPVLAGPGPCDQTASARTCTGDQSDGVVFTSPPSGLNVLNLSADIAPSIP
jgi:hypothetical protein